MLLICLSHEIYVIHNPVFTSASTLDDDIKQELWVCPHVHCNCAIHRMLQLREQGLAWLNKSAKAINSLNNDLVTCLDLLDLKKMGIAALILSIWRIIKLN